MRLIKKYVEKIAVKLAEAEIKRAVITERVRIWNKIFEAASVKPYTEPTKDGYKTTHIITIGEPKLEEIILPPLAPDEYFEADDPRLSLAAPESPAVQACLDGIKLIDDMLQDNHV